MREQLSRETHIRVVKSFQDTFGIDEDFPRLNKGDGSYDNMFYESLRNNKFSKAKATQAMDNWKANNGFDF